MFTVPGTMQYAMVWYNNDQPIPKSDMITLFAAEDREALYSYQKQDLELTLAQIMNSLLQNSGLH